MYIIEPDEKNLHGYFSRDLPPVLTVQSGETVRYRTLDANWQDYDESTDTFVTSTFYPGEGHALCGPIAIAGAKKGMVLEIAIGEIRVAKMGWNRGGGGDRPHWVKLGNGESPLYNVRWHLDREAMTGVVEFGYQVDLAPFMGVMGMPPDEPGNHPTAPPRFCGGNIDCKMLVSGTKLYLPIAVDGGLFSTGDGHAAQGDGEVSITAIECPVEQVDLTFHLHEDWSLTTPRALTHEGWITLGFHEDLDEAMYIALNAMLDLMMEKFGVSRKQALSLASVVVDMRITQVVNGTQGVHAVLPNNALKHL